MSPLDRMNRESAGKRDSATRIITILVLNLYPRTRLLLSRMSITILFEMKNTRTMKARIVTFQRSRRSILVRSGIAPCFI